MPTPFTPREQALMRRITQLETQNERLKTIKEYRSPSDNKNGLASVRDVEFMVNNAIAQATKHWEAWHEMRHSRIRRVVKWCRVFIEWVKARRRYRAAMSGEIESTPNVTEAANG